MSRGVRRFVESQSQEGERESRGEFSLNPEAALEKVARFGLDSPEKAVLRLVQFAVRRYPEKVRITLERDTVRLLTRFCKELPDLELDQGMVFGSDSFPLLLMSCLHAGYESGWVCHQEGGWKLAQEGLTPTARRTEKSRSLEIGLRLQAPESFWERLRSLLRWRCLSTRVLQSSLGFCPYSLRVDGVPLEFWGPQGKSLLEVFFTAPSAERAQGLRKSGTRLSKRVLVGKKRRNSSLRTWTSFHTHYVGAIARLFGHRSDKAWRADDRNKATVLAHFWIPLSRFAKPSITFVHHGVVVGQTEWDFPLPLCGVVSSAGLDHDLSGLQIVDNAKASKMKEMLQEQLERRLRMVARDPDLPKKLLAQLDQAGFVGRKSRKEANHPLLRDKPRPKKRNRVHQEFGGSRHQQDKNEFRTQRRQMRDRRQ